MSPTHTKVSHRTVRDGSGDLLKHIACLIPLSSQSSHQAFTNRAFFALGPQDRSPRSSTGNLLLPVSSLFPSNKNLGDSSCTLTVNVAVASTLKFSSPYPCFSDYRVPLSNYVRLDTTCDSTISS